MKYFVFALLFVGCGVSEGEHIDRPTRRPLVFEQVFAEYTKAHPTWNINNVLLEESTSELERRIGPALADGSFFANMRFKLNEIKPFTSENKIHYLASFRFDNSSYRYDDVASDIQMQVMAIISEKAKDTLVENRPYFLKGTLQKRLSNMFILLSTGKDVSDIFLPTVRIALDSIHSTTYVNLNQ